MRQVHKIYSSKEFKAVTIREIIIAMILWIFIFFTIYIAMDKFIFHEEISVNVFTTLKTVGIPMIISFGILFIISQKIISSKYIIKLADEEIIIIKNNKSKYIFPINETLSIFLKNSENQLQEQL